MTVLAQRGRTGEAGSGGLKISRPSFLWSLPAITYFSLFAIIPLGVVVWLSFTNWDGIGAPQWVGTKTWSLVFHNQQFGASIRIVLELTALGIVTQTPVSMMLGVWAAGRQRNRAILSAIYFIPLLMSALAISVVWVNLINPDFGLPHELPWLFDNTFFDHGYLQSSGPTAIGLLTFVGIWQWTPFHTLIYQGGARAIPETLYQAAAIDGAGRFRQFFHITLPQLRNTMVTSMVLMLVGGLTTFDTVLVITQGGPDNATTSLPFLMYKTSFYGGQEYGQAAVLAVVLVVVATILSILTVRATGWSKMRSTMEGI